MPAKPPKSCPTAGCRNLTTEKYCDSCKKQRASTYQKTRTDGNDFYVSTPWVKLREQFLRQNPFCVICKENGRSVPAKIADHIIPRRVRPDLALDPTNLRALCKPCHDRHGARINSKKRAS